MGWSRGTEWHQGSIIVADDLDALNIPDLPKGTMAIVTSHDCDVANDNLDAEPKVEFVICSFIQSANGNYTCGKNPRALHLYVQSDDSEAILESILLT